MWSSLCHSCWIIELCWCPRLLCTFCESFVSLCSVVILPLEVCSNSLLLRVFLALQSTLFFGRTIFVTVVLPRIWVQHLSVEKWESITLRHWRPGFDSRAWQPRQQQDQHRGECWWRLSFHQREPSGSVARALEDTHNADSRPPRVPTLRAPLPIRPYISCVCHLQANSVCREEHSLYCVLLSPLDCFRYLFDIMWGLWDKQHQIRLTTVNRQYTQRELRWMTKIWRRFHRTWFYACWSLCHPVCDVMSIHWIDCTCYSELLTLKGFPQRFRMQLEFLKRK